MFFKSPRVIIVSIMAVVSAGQSSCDRAVQPRGRSIIRQTSGCDNFELSLDTRKTFMDPDPYWMLNSRQINIQGKQVSDELKLYSVKVEGTEYECSNDANDWDHCLWLPGSDLASLQIQIPPAQKYMPADSWLTKVVALSEDSQHIFKIEVETKLIWASHLDRSNYRAAWTYLTESSALGLCCILVLIVTSCQKFELYTLFSLILVILSSAIQVYCALKTIHEDISNDEITFNAQYLLYGNAASALILSWFHSMFALQYRRASQIVPIYFLQESRTLSDAEYERTEKRLRFIRGQIVTYQALPALVVIPAVSYYYKQTFDPYMTNISSIMVLNSVSVALNAISCVILVLALFSLKRWTAQFRDWIWSKDGLFFFHLLLFLLLLLTEIVELCLLIILAARDLGRSQKVDTWLMIPSGIYHLVNLISATFIMVLFIKFSRADTPKGREQSSDRDPIALNLTESKVEDKPQPLLQIPSQVKTTPEIDLTIAFQFCEIAQDVVNEGYVEDHNSCRLPTLEPLNDLPQEPRGESQFCLPENVLQNSYR